MCWNQTQNGSVFFLSQHEKFAEFLGMKHLVYLNSFEVLIYVLYIIMS